MKIFLLLTISLFCSMSMAMTKEEFLKLDEASKEDFINTQAEAIEDEESIEKFKENNPQLMEVIAKTADDLSNIWGDTVLEGPYALNGDIETSVSTLYTSNNEVIAVYATISAPALMIDSCEYNENTNEWGDDCTEGSVTESFVIDVEGNIIDMGYYPDFE